MTDPRPGASADDIPALDAVELNTYFVLMEAVSLLEHRIEQQLRAEGDISYVQFQLLARLNARGPLTMTDAGRALLNRVMPGHVQVTRLLLDPLSDLDLDHLRDIMTRVRDHMRA